MNSWIETINTALFNNVKTPFFVFVAVFVIIVALTIAFAVHEIRNDIS